MRNGSEQVWAKQLGKTSFELRSLPFFAYGMAPGDVLETTGSYELVSVNRGTNHVLRIAVAKEISAKCHGLVHGQLETLALSHEWHASGYVSIELPTTDIPESLLDLLAEFEQDGLYYEISTL